MFGIKIKKLKSSIRHILFDLCTSTKILDISGSLYIVLLLIIGNEAKVFITKLLQFYISSELEYCGKALKALIRLLRFFEFT